MYAGKLEEGFLILFGEDIYHSDLLAQVKFRKERKHGFIAFGFISHVVGRKTGETVSKWRIDAWRDEMLSSVVSQVAQGGVVVCAVGRSANSNCQLIWTSYNHILQENACTGCAINFIIIPWTLFAWVWWIRIRVMCNCMLCGKLWRVWVPDLSIALIVVNWKAVVWTRFT